MAFTCRSCHAGAGGMERVLMQVSAHVPREATGMTVSEGTIVTDGT